MDHVDSSFELYLAAALSNFEFGIGLTEEDEIRIFQLTTTRVDVVKKASEEVFTFRKYFTLTARVVNGSRNNVRN